MNRTLDLLLGAALLLVLLTCGGLILRRWLQRSQDEPSALILKWILTLLLVLFFTLKLLPAIATGGQAGAFLVPFAAVCGLVLAFLWGPNITSWFGERFEKIYTGGHAPPDPQPMLSIAQAQRKRGQFHAALGELHQQLVRFPGNIPCQLLMAEIQASDLKELEAARQTIESLCAQESLPPEIISGAWSSLADWYLKESTDLNAARQCFQRILDTLPETPQAERAAQRLAHLADANALLAVKERGPIQLKKIEGDLGLRHATEPREPAAPDPESRAAQLALHLEQHPLDHEAREQLALLYANYYRDLNLAKDQLEILIQNLQQPERHRFRWLNLLADLQIQHDQSFEDICQTLQRIIDLHPDGAAAAQARQRMDHVRLDLKARTKGRSVPLGSADQDLGLNNPPPKGY